MRFFKCLPLMLILMIIAGCINNTSEDNIYQKINKKYMDIGDYTAKGTINVYSNKTENSYKFEEYKKAPDKYLINYVDDKVRIMFDNETTTVKNDKVGGEISLRTTKDEYFYLFIDSFFKNYFTGESATVQTSKSPTQRAIMLECDMQSTNSHVYKQKLWINAKSILPEKMEITSADGNTITKIEFSEFKFYKTLDEKFFDLENNQ